MQATDDTGLRAFIHSLPKTEHHLHIEGALPWELLRAAHPDKYQTPPASWQPGFRFRDFAEFEAQLIGYASDFFTTPQRYHDCAVAVFRDRLARNVHSMEISFASGCVDFQNLDGREVADALRAAVPEGLSVRIFLGIHHNGWTPRMTPVLEEALSWSSLDGIDLHGPEDIPVSELAPAYWQRARDAGKRTKAHAGEFQGAEFIRYAIESLGVRQIQHGVRAIEDPAVVDLLLQEDVTLDICPVSNVKLGVVDSPDAHPVRGLFDAGVRCTLSTDDPVVFGNTLEDEYLLLARHLGFTRDELAILAQPVPL